MKDKIVKIQRRSIAVFVTVPSDYAKTIKNASHMKVSVNEKGNLEYEPI